MSRFLRTLMVVFAFTVSSFAVPGGVEVIRLEVTTDELLQAMNAVSAVAGRPARKAQEMTEIKSVVLKTRTTIISAVLGRADTTALLLRLAKGAHEVEMSEEGFTVTMALGPSDPPTVDLSLVHKGITTAVTVFEHQSVLMMSADPAVADGVRFYLFVVP